MNVVYNHEYPSCAKTFATLRIYDIHPDTVSIYLGLQPTHTQIPSQPKIPRYGWFLSSRDHVDSEEPGRIVESLDARYHLDWLLDQLADKQRALESLKQMGAKIDIACYWMSRNGPACGGPTLSGLQMKRLGDLDIDFWFDLY